MNYSHINSQKELDDLNSQICWDDSAFSDMYCGVRIQSYFPSDIQYSGRFSDQLNYHCLYSVCSAPKSHLEIIFIGTEIVDHHTLLHMFLRGKVHGGRGVELFDYKGNITLKCARIIYRFVELEDYDAFGYFLKPGILDYPAGLFNSEGYCHISNEPNHLLISETENGIELTVSNTDDEGHSISLNHNQIVELADALRQSLRKR
jgi:hypothetical protein